MKRTLLPTVFSVINISGIVANCSSLVIVQISNSSKRQSKTKFLTNLPRVLDANIFSHHNIKSNQNRQVWQFDL